MKDQNHQTLTAEIKEEDKNQENILRPLYLKDFLGQKKLKKIFPFLLQQQKTALTHLITPCFMDLRVLARQL